MKQKLKIGLLLNSYKVPLWEYVLIEELLKSNYCDIELIITNNKKNLKELLFKK